MEYRKIGKEIHVVQKLTSGTALIAALMVKMINLSGNNLTGSVPRELIQKSNSGSLMLRIRDLSREEVTVEVIDWADLRADFFDSLELNPCPNLHKSLSRPPR
ncbi:hypothetical protein CsatA_016314 [Cannabis sativa]